MRRFLFSIAGMAIVLVMIGSSAAEAVVINASQRGAVSATGVYSWGSPGAGANYVVQNQQSNTYHNFFVFDVSSLNNTWVTSSALRLQRGGANFAGGQIQFRDFSQSSIGSAMAAYYDAQSGPVFASTSAANHNCQPTSARVWPFVWRLAQLSFHVAGRLVVLAVTGRPV